jgi:glycosyltransferase involved in cell wall biosynthesis
MMSEINNQYLITEPPADTFNGNLINLKKLPRVSFCIPTYNNNDTIERCLKSITGQDYPDLEIVIVDGYSTDGTVEIARKYTDKIFYDGGKLGSARQTSIENSTGEILAIFDSDIIIPYSGWLINAIAYFNYNNKVSTVWPMNVAPGNASLITKLYFNHWKIMIEDRIKKGRCVCGGGNALFVRKYFEEIGGVDRNLHWGEDFDWANKLKNSGYRVIYIRDPLQHDTMRSWRQYFKKQFVGARTFTNTGFQLMNLSFTEVLYEQVFLGIKGMISGLILQRDISWLLYPVYISTRVLAYAYNYLVNIFGRRSEINDSV